MRFKFIFCSKRMKQSPSCLEVIPCNNADSFLMQDNASLLFLYLELSA